MNTKLINFNIPTHLVEIVDELVSYKNVSRTSIINRLLDDWSRYELRLLDKDGRFRNLITNVKLRNKVKPSILKNSKDTKKPINKSIDSFFEDFDKKPSVIHLKNVESDDWDWEKDRWG